MEGDKMCRVLSIQSHVVRGYVGNRSAVFPLQILGFEVDYINSVQFSNHTGYQHWKGPVLSCDDIDVLYETLKKNDVIYYDYVLTGFCFDKKMLEKMVEIIKELKKKNPNLIYVCDPVMGDIRKNVKEMYVPKELLPVFQEKVLPVADILTPNQYEAELLTNSIINNEADVITCINDLHKAGPKVVVISSTNVNQDENFMDAYTSEMKGLKCIQGKLTIPKIFYDFVGTGDLFAALLLAWTHLHQDNTSLALQKVCSTMQHVLKRTKSAAEAEAGEGNTPTFSNLELRLVQSKKDIEDPQLCVEYFNIP